MFSFLRRRRELREARTKIGVDLHRQIREALTRDDLGASQKLSSAFTTGYIYTFVRDAFMSLGLDASKDLDSHIRFICDGVLPGKLYKIYSDQGAALALAREMQDQDKEIRGTGLSPSAVTKLFMCGARSGSYDAPLVSIQSTPPDNLRRYLLDETTKS